MLKKLMLASVLALQAFAASAADVYPSKPIKFVVPYPPGGPTDLMARLLQTQLQTRLNTTVIVDNRAGAGGNIGTADAARAAPDGYTLLMGTVASQTRAVGERAAKLVGIELPKKSDETAKKAQKAVAKKAPAKKAPAKKAPAKKAAAKKVTQK